jgi:hypothetical protein
MVGGYNTVVGSQYNCICASASSHNTVLGGLQALVNNSSYATSTAGGLYTKHDGSTATFSLASHHAYIVGSDRSSIATTFYGALCSSTSGHLNTTVGGTYCFGFATTKFSNLYKNANYFKINHPDPSKSDKFLWHSNVEAPTEGDTLYKYQVTTCNGFAEIELPSYFKHLNRCPQVWVTSNDSFGSAYGVIDQDLSKVTFCSDTDGNYSALILATRKDCHAVQSWCGVERYNPIMIEVR